MGEQVCLDALIAGTITELEDDEVYELRERAFYDCLHLTSVNLPACTSVGYVAFYDCLHLTSVELPACTSVGANAFRNCYALTSVELPACTSVGASAFNGCNRLTSITLGYNGVAAKDFNAIPSQFESGGAGTIYVPASQLAAYQASSSWNTYNLTAIAE